MAFSLKEINYRTVADPKGFLADCDARYAEKISGAADMIADNLKAPPAAARRPRRRRSRRS